MAFILLLAKIFVLPLIFILLIGIVNLILILLARPFILRMAKIPIFYSVLTTVVYIYLYVLWGAYMRALVLNYSTYLNKWIIIALSIASILIDIKYIIQQMVGEKDAMSAMDPYDYTAQADIFSKSITVVCLSLSPFILLGFIIFFFTEGLYNSLFFQPAVTVAKLFM